jgi:hypothetical protein
MKTIDLAKSGINEFLEIQKEKSICAEYACWCVSNSGLGVIINYSNAQDMFNNLKTFGKKVSKGKAGDLVLSKDMSGDYKYAGFYIGEAIEGVKISVLEPRESANGLSVVETKRTYLESCIIRLGVSEEKEEKPKTKKK